MRSSSAGTKALRLDRARGCLLGAALGDALGATVEFMSRSEIKARYGVHKKIIGGGWLYLKPGYVTDDTQMSICVARSLLKCGGFDAVDMADTFVEWMRTGPVDIGSTVAQGLRRYIAKGSVAAKECQWHGGNGALMRVAPIAIAALGCPDSLEGWAVGQAHITHNHPLSDAVCVAVSRMIQSALSEKPLLDLLEIAHELVREHPEFTFRPYDGKAGGFVGETFATAFSSFYNTDNFEDCLVECVNKGGDADTTGAVAGMVAGAWYGARGLPKKWLNKLERNTKKELIGLAEALLEIG
ncbi:MAG: ADP-ribosyl-[dinitrogen reductase] hydrolase [Deltaproteobacteria bacterium]|nr:MAG: ADP-ribosyl-[dinitrogen reductase] hydrolase [Deltaproteobacteria bacterium]